MNERDSNSVADPAAGQQPPNDWQRLKQQSGELVEYLAYYLHAKADGLKLTGRKVLWRIELEVVGILVVAGVLLVGITLVFIGIAQGFAQLFASQPWLGPVFAGLLLLGCIGGGGWWFHRTVEMKSFQETVQKYEQRKQQQRARFGHDVTERAKTEHPDN
jgi:hypothetical protein